MAPLPLYPFEFFLTASRDTLVTPSGNRRHLFKSNNGRQDGENCQLLGWKNLRVRHCCSEYLYLLPTSVPEHLKYTILMLMRLVSELLFLFGGKKCCTNSLCCKTWNGVNGKQTGREKKKAGTWTTVSQGCQGKRNNVGTAIPSVMASR